MIEANINKGYQFMVITDHSQSLKVANGLQVERLRQNEEIKKLNEEYSEIDIYSGTEMDILPDGSLDYDDDVLSQLDYVIAAIHQSFNQSEEEIMKRLENACRNHMYDTSLIQQDVLSVEEKGTNRISID